LWDDKEMEGKAKLSYYKEVIKPTLDNRSYLSILTSSKKKCRLGPQNDFGSWGTEKLPKIVNCATIKETEKPKETMVGIQVE